MAFTPIRIRTIKPEKILDFELYIYFQEQYLKYVESGEEITTEKYEKLKTQKIAKFFIQEEDEENYQKFLDKLLEETMSDSSISVEEKTNVVEGAAQTAIERMHEDPASESSFNMTKIAAANLRKLVTENPEAVKQIFSNKDSDENDNLIRHSLDVCVLSTKLAIKMKCSDEEIDNLSIAALLHDIGITQLDEEHKALFNKKRNELTPNERIQFSEHCKISTSLLAEKPYVSKDISDLILNHEETLTGNGPNKKSKLTQSEEILSLVNAYDKRVILGMSPSEALKDLNINELGNYDLGLINKFKEVLKEEGLSV